MLHQEAQALRVRLQEGQDRLRARYERTSNAAALLQGRSALIDTLLRDIWQQCALSPTLALLAVGGYGRGELYPASDIDLLILLPDDAGTTHDEKITALIGLLWDIGLDVGHSVRTLDECRTEAARDLTVQTNLLEARLLAGSRHAFGAFERALQPLLDVATFFKAKRLEQQERHSRHDDTAFSLEPNCKESPGGLRDLQTILWIARAARLGQSWHDLVEHDLITAQEAGQLERCERLLRHIRIRLHYQTKRHEDRLLFDHQEALAAAFGITAAPPKRPAERLMQRYYRNAKLVGQLNTLLLQTLGEHLFPTQQTLPIHIDRQFQMRRERLDVRNEQVFQEDPAALLRCFLLLQQRSELKGLTARTLRALWRARHVIDSSFRRNPEHRALFLSLFQQKRGIVHELRRMNQYDILGLYLPAFGKIVGLMQHDLFHAYTVDQHIMQVIRNLRRFTMPEFAHEHPLCTRLIAGFERHWLLYIAALFHDIAKGRGGDHSRLGAIEARRFCNDHDLSEEDSELICFLVEQHLTLSSVAQKQDLADPDVIAAFAHVVRTERHLVALYLLTVADICGTSPTVWNNWKGKLLADLFNATRHLLSGTATQQPQGIGKRQEEARSLLRLKGLRPGIEEPFWKRLDTAYFMRHDADEIAWHAHTLYHRPDTAQAVVKARLTRISEGLQVMVYVADQPQLFARLCGFFGRLGYSIVDAKIHTTSNGYALDSFILIDPSHQLPYRDMIGLIEHDLVDHLEQHPPLEPPRKARISRQLRHFPITPEIDLHPDGSGRYYILSIVAADRPGLLYAIALTLSRHDIVLHTAKIATLGERAEDTFLLSGSELGKTATLIPLEQELLHNLQP